MVNGNLLNSDTSELPQLCVHEHELLAFVEEGRKYAEQKNEKKSSLKSFNKKELDAAKLTSS